jgi:hypothetical protein
LSIKLGKALCAAPPVIQKESFYSLEMLPSAQKDYASFSNKLKTWPFGQHTRIKNAHRKAAISACVFDPCVAPKAFRIFF